MKIRDKYSFWKRVLLLHAKSEDSDHPAQTCLLINIFYSTDSAIRQQKPWSDCTNAETEHCLHDESEFFISSNIILSGMGW